MISVRNRLERLRRNRVSLEAGRSGEEEGDHVGAGPIAVEVGIQRGRQTPGVCRRDRTQQDLEAACKNGKRRR